MNEELKNILCRVRELYLKYGIRSVTMDDISTELGISKKTLYQHVADKDELVGKFIDHEISKRREEICSCIKSDYNAIEELVEISLFMNKLMRGQNPVTDHDLKKYYPHYFQKAIKTRREGIYKYILSNLKKGKEEGLYRAEMDEEIIAKFYISRVEGIHLNDIFSVEEFTSMKHFMELLTYHIRGIATSKGIKELEKKIEKINI